MTAVPSQGGVPNIPAVPGKYRPIFELGRGGMADVVLAVIQGPGGFNKLQVLKRLRGELAADPEFLTMFLDEARLSARINHPNVVQTNEVGHDGKHYFLAMEYLEGQSLESFMRRAATRGEGLPLPLALRIIADSLGGLHHAHELTDFDGTPLNVVHRDISPQNVFVTYEGTTKVLDFGIAKAADSSAETRAGVVKGKVAYMAPEQLRGSKAVDRRADIFSVGAVLWRAITGKRLWKGLSDIEIFQNLARGEIPSPVTVSPDAPPRLVEICMKALAVRPADRYESALDLQADIEAYIDTMPQRNLATQREIGKLLVDLFSDHRAEVRNAVEARLKQAVVPSPNSMSGEMPALLNTGIAQSSEAGALSSSDSSVSMSGADSLPTRASRTAVMTPSASASVAAPPPPGPVYTPQPAPAPARASSAPVLLALLAAAVLVGAASYVASARLHKPGATSAQPRSTAPPVPTEMTEVSILVQPASARVFVDDELVTTSPPSVRLPRDGAKHWVRAEQVGFVPKAVLVPFEAPTHAVPLTLEPEKSKK